MKRSRRSLAWAAALRRLPGPLAVPGVDILRRAEGILQTLRRKALI
jgi:hypothetical protein